MIGQIFTYNKTFEKQKGYEKHLTSKYPDMKLAALSCMKCGINLHHWMEGFEDTPESAHKTAEHIKSHPLVPKDIIVRGLIIDSETGELLDN